MANTYFGQIELYKTHFEYKNTCKILDLEFKDCLTIGGLFWSERISKPAILLGNYLGFKYDTKDNIKQSLLEGAKIVELWNDLHERLGGAMNAECFNYWDDNLKFKTSLDVILSNDLKSKPKTSDYNENDMFEALIDEISQVIMEEDGVKESNSNNKNVREIKQQMKHSPQHAICFIFVLFAHKSDGNLKDEEILEIKKSLLIWLTEPDEMKINSIYTSSCNWYLSIIQEEPESLKDILDYCLMQLNTNFTDTYKKSVMTQLVNIANSDEDFTEGEVHIIRYIAEGLEVNVEPYLLTPKKHQINTEDTQINEGSQKLTDVQISKICSKIESEKLLPFLPYIYKDLSSKGFDTDKHNPFYFNSSVKIGDDGDNMHGFLYVNMDGFFSNCVNDDEVTHIFSWDLISDLKIKINSVNKGCIIDLCTEQGILSIQDVNGSSLKIIKTIYDNIWKDVINKFKDQPMIIWNEIEDMGVNMKSFDSLTSYIEYSEEGHINKSIVVKKEVKPKSKSPDKTSTKTKVIKKDMQSFTELFNVEKDLKALNLIYEKSHKLWSENLKKISKVKYIMFCEAPPFDADGSISNYIYDRTGEAKGMYLKAPYKALKGVVDSYPSKSEMIDFLNNQGFLFLDVVPLSINYSPKRNTKKYKDFVKYFWNGTGIDLGFSEYIVQNRITEMKSKISKDLRVCFSLKSISMVVNSISTPNLKLGDKTIHISENLVGLNSAGQPSVTEIKKAFETKVIK